ncbi:MAG: S9 family peptidase [Thermoleophilia bacterium]|nr:S9 family peptidase [Thermoleophilia bacterium]
MATLTAELLVDRVVPREVAVSPDGRLVAFAAGPFAKRDEHPESAVWLVPSDGSEPARKVTAGAAEDKHPRWSRDGRWLFFLSDRRERGEAQLHRLPLAGGEAEQLTEGKPGIADFAPLAGGRVALLSADPPAEEDDRRERERDDAQVFGEEWKPQRLRLLDPETGDVRTLAATGDAHVAAVAPSPDGSALAAVLWQTPETDNFAREAELALVDPDRDEVTRRWALPSGGFELAWFGDSRRLALLGSVEAGGQVGYGLYVLDVDASGPRLLTRELPACPVLLAEADTPFVALARGLDTLVAQVGDAELAVVAEDVGAVDALAASPDGSVVAAVVATPEAPEDVWAGAAGDLRRVSDLAPELRALDRGRHERLSWRAADGLELDGLLVLPPGRDRADGPFALFTMVHGGPYGRFDDRLDLHPLVPAQWLAHAGYAVYLPNPRGGMGHGLEFAASVRGAVGVDDWQDVLSGLDVLVEAGVADPERLAIGGWSQGGFMTAWAVGQTDRFRAGVMGAGVSDWGMMVAESDSPTFEGTLGGSTGWEGPGPHRHDELSPISYAARVRTPVLILHGENDERVPVSQGRFFARALRAHGVPFQLVVYPREPHGIRERNHLLDLLARWRGWVERWVPAQTERG